MSMILRVYVCRDEDRPDAGKRTEASKECISVEVECVAKRKMVISLDEELMTRMLRDS